MKSTLSIGFNEAHRFSTGNIKIENTPIVPIEGQSIRIRWSEFLEDKALCRKLEDFEEEDMFLVHVVTIEFKKEEVITHLVLHAETDYHDCYAKSTVFKTIDLNDILKSRRINPNNYEC